MKNDDIILESEHKDTGESLEHVKKIESLLCFINHFEFIRHSITCKVEKYPQWMG